MAFSKAKILRFNDVQSCAPPPGAYTPKFDNHVLGSVVYNKDNPKPKCPESPTSSCSEGNSTMSVPTFRTPTIPRRRKRAMTDTDTLGAASKIFNQSDENSEELREKIVECTNKDETIKDLELQIDELKLIIGNLKNEKEDLIKNKDELQMLLKNVREELEFVNKQLIERKEESQIICDEFATLKAEFKTLNIVQMKKVQENITLLEEQLRINLLETDNSIKETKMQLAIKETTCGNLEEDLFKVRTEYQDLERKYEEVLNQQDNLRKKYIAELDLVNDQHALSIVDKEKSTAKIVAQWQEIASHLEMSEEEIKMRFEFEKEELIKQYNNKLDEMKFITEDLTKEKKKIEFELDAMFNKLCIEKQETEKYKKELVTEKQRSEITLNNTNEQMQTLKHDLLISQQNLSRLVEEVRNLESAKLELQQQFDSLNTDNKTLKNIYETDQTKIAELEIKLQGKDAQIKELQTFSSDQKETFLNAQSLVTQVKHEMQKLEEKIVDYQFKEQRKEQEIERVKQDLYLQNERNAIQTREISALEKNIVLKEDELKQSCEKRTAQEVKITELAKALKERELEINDLLCIKCNEYEKIIAEQNALIGPFREQLERFEAEYKILLAHKMEAEKEAKEMGLKYAEIAGHQNHKQKLKHMMDLKKKNITLVEQKQDYETQLLQKNRTIEKLQNKIEQLTVNKPKLSKQTDKENIFGKNSAALKEQN